MKLLIASVSALAIAASVTPAFAAGNAVQGLADLRQLNLIVFGNVNGNGSDIEGKAFVGGNLTASDTVNNANSHGYSMAASAFPSLTVGGNINNININNANNPGPGFVGANIGGSGGSVNVNASPSILNVGGTVHTNVNGGQTYNHNVVGLADSIATQTTTFVSDLKALSTALAALPQTAGSSYYNPDQNTNQFIAVNGGAGFAVIDVTAAQMAAANNFTYNIPTVAGGGYLPTIINVTGASGTLNIHANSNNSAYDPYVLFNYVDATNIAFGNQVSGSVLAPKANISNASPIEGSVVAANFTQGGEIHIGNFLGQGLTDGSKKDRASGLDGALRGGAGAVPEPATWAMMLTGFGLAGVALRRRRTGAAFA